MKLVHYSETVIAEAVNEATIGNEKFLNLHILRSSLRKCIQDNNIFGKQHAIAKFYRSLQQPKDPHGPFLQTSDLPYYIYGIPCNYEEGRDWTEEAGFVKTQAFGSGPNHLFLMVYPDSLEIIENQGALPLFKVER